MRKRSVNSTMRSAHGGQERRPGFDRRRRSHDVEPVLTATIVERVIDPAYSAGLVSLSDALVLQMFDSGVGETLRMAYTMLQEHQERQNGRAARSAAADALRTHLAQLDDGIDEL